MDQNAILKITHPDGKTENYVIQKEIVKIGRDAQNDIVLNYPNISRRHAEITEKERGLTIKNISEHNILIVDGVKIIEQEIKKDSEIILGDVKIKVDYGSVQDKTDPNATVLSFAIGETAKKSHHSKPILIIGILLIILSLGSFLLWLIKFNNPGVLSSKIYNKNTLMTIAYKAYGNPNAADGKYWLAKGILENIGKGVLRDIKVSFQIPEYIPWTTPDTAAELQPGQTAIFVFYPNLPQRVTNIQTRTPATLEIKIEYSAGKKRYEKIEKKVFEFRGVNEIEFTSLPATEILNWYDITDNTDLLCAFVTDEDETVKKYFGKIGEVSGGFPVIKGKQELLTLAKSIYDYELKTGMTYTGTKGVPEKIGDIESTVQSIRLPRDVINQNQGTCIELSILMSALAERAGAEAYLLLLPGHALTVVAAEDGYRQAIETTGIGGAQLGGSKTFEEALDLGEKIVVNIINKDIPCYFIDIQSFKSTGIRPPELEKIDISSLDKVLNERLAREEEKSKKQPEAKPKGEEFTVVKDSTGVVSIPYPATWEVVNVGELQSEAPFFTFGAKDTEKLAEVDVLNFEPGELQDCIKTFSDFFAKYGFTLEHDALKKIGSEEINAHLMNITLKSANENFKGIFCFIILKSKKIVGISLSVPADKYLEVKDLFFQILNDVIINEEK